MKRLALMPLSKTEPRRSEETLVRLTPQGERLAARLEAQTPKERERTMREIMERARRAQADLREQRKRIILDVLRTEGDSGGCVLLERLCQVLDITVMETFLLLHELNRNLLDPDDCGLYVYCFFNDGSGEVWCELWEPNGAERAR